MRKNCLAKRLMVCLLSVGMLAGDVAPAYASFTAPEVLEGMTDQVYFQDEGAAKANEPEEYASEEYTLNAEPEKGKTPDEDAPIVSENAQEVKDSQESGGQDTDAGQNGAQNTDAGQDGGPASSGESDRTPEEPSQETSQDTSESTSQETSQDTSESTSQETSQDTSEDTSQSTPQDTAQEDGEVLEELTDDSEGALAEGVEILQIEEVTSDEWIEEYAEDDMLMALGGMELMSLEDAKLMALQAEEGSLQAKINEADEEIPTIINLDQDYAENIVIPDGKIITLDLNGHTLSPVREEGVASTLTAVTVFGTLTVQGEGSVTAKDVTNVRGIVVANGGSLTLNSGSVCGYQIDEGSGAGILVSPGGSFTMNGGTVSENTAADYGGGIFAYNAKALAVSGGTVSQNKAAYGAGIGVNNLPSDFAALGAVTIEGNTASQSGGGLYLGNGNMSFAYDGTVIRNNTAEEGNGGGVYYAGQAEVTIGSAEITGNSAGTSGGGVYFAAAATAALESVQITGNTCAVYGGGLYFQQGSKVTIDAGSISENSAGTIGGGFIIYSNNNTASTLTINGGSIDGNTLTFNAAGRYGAGLYVYNNTTVTMKDGSVSNNTGASRGGGVYQNGGTFTLEGGRIADNTARSVTDSMGMGLYVNGTFLMRGGEISGNRCENGSSTGGGIYFTTSAELTGGVIRDNTVTGNGGGLYSSAGSLTLDGDILIEGNTAGNGGGCFIWNSEPSVRKIVMKGGTIRNNKAGSYGGLCTHTLELEGGEISDNTATGSAGGVWCRRATVTGGKIAGNTAGGSYGGMYVQEAITMTGGEISGNTAGSNGGGLGIARAATYVTQDAASAITGGRIINNTAGASYAPTATGYGFGGGIYAGYGNSTTTVSCILEIGGDAEISGNRANEGGGLRIGHNYKVTVSGGVITGNTASINGGGIHQSEYSSKLAVTGGVIQGNNSAQYGHDIYVYNYSVGDGNPVSSYYERPVLTMYPAQEMGAEGIWHDEIANQDIAGTETIDNTAFNEDLENAEDRTTGRREAYTFVLRKAVAQIDTEIYDSLQEAVDAIAAQEPPEGEILLLEDTVECVTVPQGITAVLNLQGHTVRGAGGSVITVAEGASLTIRDTSEGETGEIRGGMGNVIDEAKDYRAGGGLFIEGTVIIEGGSVCENGVNRYGGALYIRGNGVCEMKGGSIRDNSASSAGGGIYIIDNGHFTLEKGEITGNNLSALRADGKNTVIDVKGGTIARNTGTNGAGISVTASGTVNISGGEITGNTSSGSGGALYMSSGTINLTGGEITGNISGSNGGGLYMDLGTLYMAGGAFRGNTATNGGAVYLYRGALVITDGEVTGNTAKSDGGGIFYSTNNASYKLEVTGGKICDNLANTGSANDIYLTANSNVAELMAAKDMGLEAYDCWFDAQDGTQITEKLVGRENKYYYLTASKISGSEESVARIEEACFRSIQEAVNAAAEGDTIYLLRDCRESVSVSAGKSVTVDLNGFSLTPDKRYVFLVTGEGSLHLQSTYTENDRNLKGNIGILMPEEGAENTRAVYVTGGGSFELGDGVTIQNFSVAANGGAIYAAGGKVNIQGGTIQNCQAAYGGGVYVATSSGVPVELRMSGGVIRGCEASTEGGGIYYSTSGNKPEAMDKLDITGGTIESCSSGGSGGGLRILGKSSASSCAETFKVAGVTVQNNTAGTNGGGAYIVCQGQDVTVKLGDENRETIFQGNQAASHGALYIYGANARNEHVTMKNVQILENRSTGNYGGVYIERFAGVTISGCTFSGNRTINGNAGRGALQITLYAYGETSLIKDTVFEKNYSLNSPVTLTQGNYKLQGVTVRDNDTYGFAGISCSGDSTAYNNGNATTLEVYDCEFYNNRSATSGSALSCDAYSTMTLKGGTTIRNNTSGTTFGTVNCTSFTAVLYVEDAEISGNTVTTTSTDYGGGGIFCYEGQTFIKKEAVIRDNTALRGGGIFVHRRGRLTIEEGSQISGNQADYGGGIYIRPYIDTNIKAYLIPSLTVTGGEISGNSAGISGGGIYVENSFIGNSEEIAARNITTYIESKDTKLEVSGGLITGNTAGSYGGGVFTSYNGTLFRLLQGGRIYGNSAGLGQDIYGAYNGNYIGSTYYRQNELQLIKAADMFADDPEKRGIGWLDEIKGQVIQEAVTGKMIRAYALTLDYETDDVVALIGNEPYTSIQEAIDAAGAGDDSPEIRIVRDVTESVSVPSGTSVTLNLNGYKLQGVNTALSVYGNLIIKDDPADAEDKNRISYPAGTDTGTITGSGVDAGGGVRVYSGGYAKMESGQISGCRAGERENTTTNGGAGVCVDSGTFELAGGVICENVSRYGAAVLVRTASSKFLMTGGTIRDNQATSTGVIYNRGGSVQITGGVIEDNKTLSGTINNNSGTTVITGTEENRPVIRNNTVSSQGGAIYVNSGTVTLGYADILSNSTTNARTTNVTNSAGGGVYVYSGTLNITEGTVFSGNSAVRGGAVYNQIGSVKIVGGTITKNRAQMGGGIAQHPSFGSTVELMAGAVYNNTSTLSSAGNDFYSRYEGTGQYNPMGSNYPRLTLIPASGMGNSRYNVWRDDTYTGDNRTGMLLLEGEYITGSVTQANNVELTADYYDTELNLDISSDFNVSELHIGKYNDSTGLYEGGMTDGIGSFDTAVKEQEITAKMLLDSGGAVRSAESYMAEGEEKYYISYNEKLYEEEQAVSWTPGKDSSSANGIIRSFDTLTYSLSYTIEANNKASEDESAVEKTVHVWLEAELPLDADEGEFSVTANTFEEYTVLQKLVDGRTVQVLRGYKKAKVTNEARGTFNVSVNIKGMKNGDTFKPVFRSWIEGNEENEENCPEAQSKMLTVSASGQYNVVLDNNTQLSYTGYFDLSSGEETTEEEYKKALKAGETNIVYGTMLGYGITAELYKEGNNLRGFELPEDELSFDISMKGSLLADGEAVEGGLSTAPYLWAYKENENTVYGRPLNSTANSFNMDWNDEDDKERTTRYAYNAAPFNTGGNNYSCYNGGSWTVSGAQTASGQKENTFHVTVSGYTINSDANPNCASDTVSSRAFNSSSVKPFTAGYLQVIFPITQEQKEACNGKYMQVYMEAAVSGLEVKTVSGQTPETTETGLETLEQYFGDAVKEYAVNEMRYADNYISFEAGMYVFLNNSGPGDSLVKENYFLKEDRSELSGRGGSGTTPLDSVVYIEGRANYGSTEYDTQNKNDLAHYINPEVFNPQTDNYKEYNYLTALNLLQKFDADAYTPVGAGAIVKAHPAKTTTGTNAFGNGAFYVATDETATEWSDTKTRDYELTVLYAAKPDGTNWIKEPLSANSEQDDGGVADMDSCREENLIYFTTLEELYSYFEAQRKEGKCVAILYEFRDCCIRTGRYLSAQARMQVTSDFERTGGTYCTTNDIRAWTTYRPEYKLSYRSNELNKILYDFSWTEVKGNNGAYGLGLEKNLGFYAEFNKGDTASIRTVDANNPQKKQYEDDMPVTRTVTGTYPGADGTETTYTTERVITRMAAQSYINDYVKSQYSKGSKEPGTHNGERAGNTLLLYTLDSSISIRTDDITKGGSATSFKTVYNISQGERIVKYEVAPALTIASAVQDHVLVSNGSQAAEVHIILSYPEGLSYLDKSISFDYTDSDYEDGELEWTVGAVTENADGSSSMEVTTVVSDINRKLPVINFGCEIGNPGDNTEDLKSGASLVTTAQIYATYEEHNNIAVDTHKATSTIQIMRNSNDGIYLDTGGTSTLKDVGEDFTFVMHYYRGDIEATGKKVEMANVLPYVGDGRGTDFTGGYYIKDITLKFNDSDTFHAFVSGTEDEDGNTTNQGVIKYVSGQKTQDDLIKNGRSAETELTYTVGKNYTVTVNLPDTGLLQLSGTDSGLALYIGFLMKTLRGNSTVDVAVTLSSLEKDGQTASDMIVDTKGSTQAGGNVYGDDFVFKDSQGTMESSQIAVKVFNRRITGMAWMDMDHDGKYVAGSATYISSDKRLAGIDVTLYVKKGDNWVPAVDTVGALVPSVETDAKGFYAFENLPEGTYRVEFADSDDNYTDHGTIGFERLSVTKRTDNTSSISTSRVVPVYADSDPGTLDEDTRDALATLKKAALPEGDAHDIILPALGEDTAVSEYVTANWNAGFYYVEARLEKVWENMRTPLIERTSVTLKLKGETGTSNTDASSAGTSNTGTFYDLTTDYVLTQGAASTSVTAEKNSGTTQSETVPVTVTSQNSAQENDGGTVKLTDYRWSLTQALQAEGSSGPVTYTMDEETVPSGYIKSTDDTFESSTGITYFTVTNRQQHGEFSFLKVAYEDYANTLSGAEFKLYYWNSLAAVSASLLDLSSPDSWKLLETVTTGEDGKVLFGSLPAGYYRLVETAAPEGRALPKVQWTIQVAFETNENQELQPVVTRTRITGTTGSSDGTSAGDSDDGVDFVNWPVTSEEGQAAGDTLLILPNKPTVSTPTGVSLYNNYLLLLLLLTAALGVYLIWERRRRTAKNAKGR